jgi:hypothetical protein
MAACGETPFATLGEAETPLAAAAEAPARETFYDGVPDIEQVIALDHAAFRERVSDVLALAILAQYIFWSALIVVVTWMHPFWKDNVGMKLTVTGGVVVGLMQVLRLHQANHRMRMKHLMSRKSHC